jgi:hypothetical protein
LYVDGTKVAANAGKESVKPRFAVEAHLTSLFDMEAVEPVDEEEQQRPQEEPAGSGSLVQLPVSLGCFLLSTTKNTPTHVRVCVKSMSKKGPTP